MAVDPQYLGFYSLLSDEDTSTHAPGIVNPEIKLGSGFHWVDYVMFSSLLGISLGIGIFYAIKGQKSTKEYLMGGRDLKVIPTAFSIFMSFISAILILGNTAEMYQWGTQGYLAILGDCLAYGFVALVFVPLFYPLNLTSAFEYLEKRYRTRKVKLAGTVLLLTSQVLYMGIAMFAPATAMQAVTGFPEWASILACGVIATIYTTIGGMKAVIWTDVVQGCVYLAGIIVVLSLGIVRVGGIDKVWEIAERDGRIDFWHFDPNPAGYRITFWSVVVGRFIGDLQTLGCGQTSVQRYCALPSMTKARVSVLLNIPSIIILYTLTCFLGLTVYAFYAQIGCDPLKGGFIDNPNQLLPRFVMDVAGYPGIPGVFLAVLFSGALSTLSSSLGGLSAVTWKMLEWHPKIKSGISETKQALITQCLAFFFGCLGIGMAFMARILGGHVMQASNSFVSGVAGPLLGMYILGALFPWANWIGAVVGAVFGLAFTMLIAIGSYVTSPWNSRFDYDIGQCYVNATDLTTVWTPITHDIMDIDASFDEEDILTPLFKMSYLWYSSVGMSTTVIIGLIISFITGPMDPKSHDPALIIPLFDRIFCCIPISIRKRLWCGVDHTGTEKEDIASKEGHCQEKEAQMNKAFVCEKF